MVIAGQSTIAGVASEVVMRRLNELLHGIAPDDVLATRGQRAVAGVFDDSRRVQPGGIFVAVRGTSVDGRQYVADAIQRGARVILGEDLPPNDRALIVNVPDARAALTTLALRWHGLADDGCRGLQLVGVTGTNGKSTTAFMTRAILRAAGIKCGLLGTMHYDLCGRSVTAGMTTPGPLELAAYVRECADAGAGAAVMEVSSHALDQKRTAGLHFTAAAFTNLTGDHLDYHGTFENYRAAKACLFTELAPDAVAVVNADDPHHAEMIGECPAHIVRYALDADADLHARIVRSTSEGTVYRMMLDGTELVLENAIVGRHNVYNALAAAGLARALDISPDAIQRGLTTVRNIPGRLQRVPCLSSADVFVDYAHTDDALRNVLSVLRPLARKRLLVVFGCGGDRDRTKRPRMAHAVAEFADAIVVTSDNPRTEDPQAIIDDILSGFDASQRQNVTVEPDRARAIKHALDGAAEGDVVLIAGKGHEDYQIVGTQRIHFDDIEVAIQAAAELQTTSSGDAPQ